MSTFKKVSVTFAGDDEVITHIVPENVSLKSSLRYAKQKIDDKRCDITENIDVNSDPISKPTTQLTEDDDVFGANLYGFKTPKKSGQMIEKASSCAQAISSPKTPQSTSRRKSARTPTRTPKSILKNRQSILQESGQTPVTRRSQKRLQKLNTQTPHRLRARNKQDDHVGSESEDSASDWDDDTSSTYSEDMVLTTGPLSAAHHDGGLGDVTTTASDVSASRSIGNKDVLTQSATVESYFDAKSLPALTSDHTLAKLDMPRIDQEQLQQALQNVEVGYVKEREALLQTYATQYFDKWLFMMCQGFNILLHGVGSKIDLLERFIDEQINDNDHLVINGFFPSLTIKSILNAITEDILEEKCCTRGVVDHCEMLVAHFNQEDSADLVLLIHNIDGSMLRGERAQTILSQLASSRHIHVIASIDHINAPLMWDQTRASRFNWLWYDVTTFATYAQETSYENSLLVRQSGVLALSSMTHVMRSLTPNARAIFLLVVRYQLDNGKQQTYQGLAFPDLYQKCREAFLVNSDLTLRSQLTEFKDHKLLRVKKGIDGAEYLLVPLDDATLQEFLTQQDQDT